MADRYAEPHRGDENVGTTAATTVGGVGIAGEGPVVGRTFTSWERIYFHVNVALSAVSLAKAAHHLDQPVEQRGAFSIADIRTRYTNAYQAKRIFSICGIDPQEAKIKSLWEKITSFGRKAA
ncbi:hypothetical protein [Lewinella cohaerens]|uniref:hypothetical protein n=1 Tax=Lewinella cohaerens TaxID=70995 RepID=UPI0003A3F691|nr:hypothetical protein [Lewinella cohaerens]